MNTKSQMSMAKAFSMTSAVLMSPTAINWVLRSSPKMLRAYSRYY